MARIKMENKKPTSLLDIMSEEDRKKALELYELRMAKTERSSENKVSSEIYLVAEFGYYFGWNAIEAIRNNEINLEEAFALIRGARKVWYQKLVETGQVQTTACSTPFAKERGFWQKSMKPFLKESELER